MGSRFALPWRLWFQLDFRLHLGLKMNVRYVALFRHMNIEAT
ncbi:Uncharacterised protein [Vibrio cholerae]|nr:Uncharacterised protein [Vibrio cholerae]